MQSRACLDAPVRASHGSGVDLREQFGQRLLELPRAQTRGAWMSAQARPIFFVMFAE